MADKQLGAYDPIYQQYASMLQNNGYKEAIESARQNMIQSTNRQYDNNAKNYYKQYRINEAALPEKLSRLGVTGGASETAQLRLMNGYSGNLYDNETARANALNNGNMEYDRLLANNSVNVANQLADVYLNLAQQARAEQLAASSGGGGGGYGGYGGYGGSGSGMYINGVDSGGNYGSGTDYSQIGSQAAQNVLNGLGNYVNAASGANGGNGGSSNGSSIYTSAMHGMSGASNVAQLERIWHNFQNSSGMTPQQYKSAYNYYLQRRKQLAGGSSGSSGGGHHSGGSNAPTNK